MLKMPTNNTNEMGISIGTTNLANDDLIKKTKKGVWWSWTKFKDREWDLKANKEDKELIQEILKEDVEYGINHFLLKMLRKKSYQNPYLKKSYQNYI
jgi:hypothetical protein